MHFPTTTKIAILAACAAAVAACGGEPSGSNPPGSAPGIRITAGDGLADSIDAAPVQALVVQVTTPDGRPASGTVVQFESVLATTGLDFPTVWVAPVGTNDFSGFASVTADPQGRASVRVRLGSRAGPGGVTVSVPTFGFSAPAQYTIRPGAPWSVSVSPGDTTLYVGRSAPLRAVVADRAQNPRSDAVTFTVASGPVTLSGPSTVTANSIGRATIVAAVGPVADTSFVSVVPEGTIAGYSDQMELWTVNLDGTGMKSLATASAGRGYFGEMPAAWSADGKSLVYHDSRSDHNRLLYSVDVATGTRSLLISDPKGLVSEAWPQRSRDGAWIYFNGLGLWEGAYDGNQVFRVHPDGTGLERIGTGRGSSITGYASPSPDGTRVAFLTDRDFPGGGLHVADLATGQNTALNVAAATPRWSPDGGLIAYVAVAGGGLGYLDNHLVFGSGELWVIRPDGTGARRVTKSATLFLPGIDWSPDGKYLVGTGQQGAAVTVVDVATGEEVPIRLFTPLRAPTWRP